MILLSQFKLKTYICLIMDPFEELDSERSKLIVDEIDDFGN